LAAAANRDSTADTLGSESCDQTYSWHDQPLDIEGSNVVIVTHGLTLRVILMRWFHWSRELFEATSNPGNCSVITLHRKQDPHPQPRGAGLSDADADASPCRWFELDPESLAAVGLTPEVLHRERESRQAAPL